MAIEFFTAGESHGEMLVGTITDIPSGLDIDEEFANAELRRRRSGYGRSERMKLELDRAEFVTGVRGAKSIGSPITVIVKNSDRRLSATGADELFPITAVRPGHADLSGAVKYSLDDARNIAERASARGTAAIVAVGAVAKMYLKRLGIEIESHTLAIGGVTAKQAKDRANINSRADADELRCLDGSASAEMKRLIDKAASDGDTLGGVAEIVVTGCKSGIGSCMSVFKRLDGLIMRNVGFIPSVKAVEIGEGIWGASALGSQFHDRIYMSENTHKAERKTNFAGGIEGGMTNGEPIVVRAFFKPVPTLANGISSVDLKTRQNCAAAVERSDVCIVPAGGVVCESAVALALANAVSDMLGGDTMDEVVRRYAEKESVV